MPLAIFSPSFLIEVLVSRIKPRGRPAKISETPPRRPSSVGALHSGSILRRQKFIPVVPIGKRQAGRRCGRHAPSSRVGATGPHRGSALDRENRRAERSRSVAID